jgi:uncharacterized protein YndB with AHSA1/START domain
LWRALTDPEVTVQYWGHRNISGWRTGDVWEHRHLDDDGPDLIGSILVVEWSQRLAHTWALRCDAGKETRHSRVMFDIEVVGEVTRLTVRHDGLAVDQMQGTEDGWAKVLSNLKSFPETGRPLPSLL